MAMGNFDYLPASVDYVVIEGLGRTKDDYARRFVKEVFHARNFSELVLLASEAGRNLETNGCFNKVNVLIDTNKRDGASKHGYEVTFVVNEMKRVSGGISTMVGSNEGSIVLTARMPNVLGRGERISVEHTFGSNSQKGSHLTIAKPVPQAGKAELSFTLSQNQMTHYQAGFNLTSRGGLLDFTFQPFPNIKHSFQWEGAWREMESASRKTSFDIREQSGHSVKSALRHIATIDHRDSFVFPTKGMFLKIIQEFAGVGGDVAFLKNEADCQLNISLPAETVLQTTLRCGLFHGLSESPDDDRKESPTYNSSDLFFLGGPQTLRGFEMRSMGPRSESNVLGGKAYWATGLHLFAPLPFALGKGSFGDYCRTHFFVNAGSLVGNSLSFNGEENTETLQSLVSDFKVAYGLGLAIRLGQARVELNYCWPLRYSTLDKIRRGFQFGIGMDFV